MPRPPHHETEVSQIDALHDAPSVAVESSIKRRSIGSVPLVILAVLVIGGFAFWPGGGDGSSDEGAAAPADATSTSRPDPAEDSQTTNDALDPVMEPLPFGLERVFVILRKDSGRVGVVIDADGAITEIDLNSERAVEPDATGENVAQLDVAGVLRAGPPDSLEVVDVDVVDFVWHETDAGRLLYLTRSPGGVSEMVERSFTETTNVRRLVSDESGRPVWFGGGGYAVLNRTSPEMVRVYNNDGEVVRVLPFGVVLGESPTGDVYYTNDDGGSLVLDMATGRTVEPNFVDGVSLTGVRRSPTGALSAVQVPVQTGSGLFIMSIDGVLFQLPGDQINGSTLGWNRNGAVLGFVSQPRGEPERGRQAQIGLINLAGEPQTVTIEIPVDGSIDHVRIL